MMNFIESIKKFVLKKLRLLVVLKKLFNKKEIKKTPSLVNDENIQQFQSKKIWMNKNGKNVLIESKEMERYMLKGYARGMAKRQK